MADNQTPPAATDYSGVREYIGARYVPVFANPPEWNDTRGYEPLTIVLHKGNSFTSTQYVPTGIDISNTEYWLETGNWNAQIEAYREEVLRFDARITQNANGIEANMAAIADEATARASADTALQQLIESEETARKAADAELANRMNDFEQMTPLDTEKGRTAVFIGDSFMAPSTSYPQKLAYFVCQLTGWTMYNYSYGGSGWVDEAGAAMNFYHQIQKAASEISVEADRIDYVIIGGGFNDWNDTTPLTYSQLYSAAANTMKEAHAKFPNAKLIVIPMMFRNFGVDTHMHDLYSAIVAGCNSSNVPMLMIPQAYLWQLGFKNVDGVHPTVELYKIMAEYIVSWVFGGGVKTERMYEAHVSTKQIDFYVRFMNCDGIMNAMFSDVTVKSTINDNITVMNQVPLFAASNSTKRVPMWSASGSYIGQFVFSGSSMLFVPANGGVTAATYAGGSVSYPLWVKTPQ
jgi:hypothetical protein